MPVIVIQGQDPGTGTSIKMEMRSGRNDIQNDFCCRFDR